MKNLKKYTLPVFMTISGILTTVADLIQKNEIAIILAIVLGVIGAVALFLPSSILNKATASISDIDASQGDFSFKSLGASCLLLSAAVFGFSTLSAKAAPEGGIIASQYPEIRQIQDVLGIMQTDVAEIKGHVKDINDKSDKIIAATFPWIELWLYTSVSNAKQNDGKYLSTADSLKFVIYNETPVNFENFVISIHGQNGFEVKEKYDFISSNLQKDSLSFPYAQLTDVLSVCVSAKIKGRNEWVVDQHDIKSSKSIASLSLGEWENLKYEKLNNEGPKIYLEQKSCS